MRVISEPESRTISVTSLSNPPILTGTVVGLTPRKEVPRGLAMTFWRVIISAKLETDLISVLLEGMLMVCCLEIFTLALKLCTVLLSSLLPLSTNASSSELVSLEEALTNREVSKNPTQMMKNLNLNLKRYRMILLCLQIH